MKYKTPIFLFSFLILVLPVLWLANIPQGINLLNNTNPEEDTITSGLIFKAPIIPENVFFAGEEVPIWIPEVRERLENEMIINNHWHSNTIMMMKMAPRWFPLFERLFDSLGVPQDFKYVSLVESRLKNEDSPVGAAGFWHLMPATAKDYGLYLDEEVDERYDPVKSTVVAGRYFKDSKELFGTWTDAAASFNRGKSGYIRAIQHQKVNNFFDLKLNSETSRYVFRIIAVKLILESPQLYGYSISKNEMYKPLETKSIVVNSSVDDWADFALENGTIYKYVRLYNPWIQEKYLNNKSNRSYTVLIPKNSKTFKTAISFIDSTLVDTLKSLDEFDSQE